MKSWRWTCYIYKIVHLRICCMCVKWMVIPKSQAFFSKSDPYAVYQVVQFNVNKKRCSSLTKIWLQKSCLQPPTFNEKKFLSTISKAKSWAHLQVGNWASQQSGTQYLIPKRHETWKRRGKIEWTYEICDIPICRYLYIYIYTNARLNTYCNIIYTNIFIVADISLISYLRNITRTLEEATEMP